MDGFLQVRLTAFAVVGAVIAAMWSVPASACRNGPEAAAFSWSLVEDANPQPNGMILVGFRDESVGGVTHVAFHRVARILPGVQDALPESEASRYAILHTDGTLGPLTYIIMREALYYGTDLDSVGLPRRVWFDPEEDGVSGNERLVFSRRDHSFP